MGTTNKNNQTNGVVQAMYRVMTGIENNLGGGEGVEGLYGSIKGGGMQKILDTMRDKCGLDEKSHLVDIGAGLGRPLLHAMVSMGISGASGIELDRVKCDKAASFLRLSLNTLQKRGVAAESMTPPPVTCAPIEAIKTLEPATHAYSFWEGVPFDARAAFGRLFAASRTLVSVAVVQRSMRESDPADLMDDWYGFGPLRLVDSYPVSMSGSGRSFQAYIFQRVGDDKKTASIDASILTPVRKEIQPLLLPTDSETATTSSVQQQGDDNEEEEEAARPRARKQRQARKVNTSSRSTAASKQSPVVKPKKTPTKPVSVTKVLQCTLRRRPAVSIVKKLQLQDDVIDDENVDFGVVDGRRRQSRGLVAA